MNEHGLLEDFYRVLRVLSSDDDLTQRDLSDQLGISLGKTNYLIKSLAGKGLVKIKGFSRKKAQTKIKRVKYILTQKGLKSKLHLTYHFLKQKEKEYFDLKKELEKSSGNSAKNTRETVL